MNLFEIKAELLAVMEMAEDSTIDPQTIADTMAAVEMDFEDKADNYAYMIAQLKGEISTLKAEKNRIGDRIAAKENAVERLTGVLQNAMKDTGKVKFKTPYHNFWIQKNPPAVRWIEGAEIPEKYLVPQPPKKDGAAVLKDLKAGEKLDFAELTQSEGVRIR